MPDRPPTLCAAPGCAVLVPFGRCADHQIERKPWQHDRPSRHDRGLGSEHDRLRKIVMVEEETCWLCGLPGLPDDEADHVIPRLEGGPTTRENLRRAHRECHKRRTNAGRRPA